ncbi:MAG: hypothetical protein WBB85_03350, partial [Albidovulum sp.]|uniref:hypothetical protein n=1 Tax=Albidovulum sp. TaxID=1872424 RepID=UPI003CA4C6FE
MMAQGSLRTYGPQTVTSFCKGPAPRAFRTGAAALLVGTLLAGSASAEAFGPCAIPITAPDAVVERLDGLLAKAVDPAPELAADIGAAPGAVLSVRGPDWSYARSAGAAD